jgi:hypothetical protein
MKRNTCKNLTSSIQNLQTLLPRVDLAMNSFEPEDGVLARDEAMKILEPHMRFSFFSKETYRFLLEVLGSREELKKRIGVVETMGVSGKSLRAKLKEKKIMTEKGAEFLLKSPEFEKAEPGKKIITIRLTHDELCHDLEEINWKIIYSRASELGFGFLPHETAANLLLNDKKQLEIDNDTTIASKPMKNEDKDPSVFKVMDCSNGLLLYGAWLSPLERMSWSQSIIFSIPDLETPADSMEKYIE